MKVLRIFIVAVFLLSVLTWGIGKFHVMHQDTVLCSSHGTHSNVCCISRVVGEESVLIL